ncbi:MAG TPA: hypothetical protein PKO06_01790, partial [Candidatus Ozemobacteraceae bacterium]|nr:hypothetical protein [Candidatus Ozemobacteraceae bacterium]
LVQGAQQIHAVHAMVDGGLQYPLDQGTFAAIHLCVQEVREKAQVKVSRHESECEKQKHPQPPDERAVEGK